MMVAEFFKAKILKLSPMITADSHDGAVLLNLNFLNKKKNPIILEIVIHND
jgi:hypothetical protein